MPVGTNNQIASFLSKIIKPSAFTKLSFIVKQNNAAG
jgi:hypothetical protein